MPPGALLRCVGMSELVQVFLLVAICYDLLVCIYVLCVWIYIYLVLGVGMYLCALCGFVSVCSVYSLVLIHSSLEALNLPDRDPTGMGSTSDGYTIVATKQEVVVAKDLQRVSSFNPSYEPCMVAVNQSSRDVVIGGKVRCGHRGKVRCGRQCAVGGEDNGAGVCWCGARIKLMLCCI